MALWSATETGHPASLRPGLSLEWATKAARRTSPSKCRRRLGLPPPPGTPAGPGAGAGRHLLERGKAHDLQRRRTYSCEVLAGGRLLGMTATTSRIWPSARSPHMRTETPARPRLGPRAAVLLMAPFLAQADATIANVAIPAIRFGLHASGAAAEAVIGGYLIAFAVLVITGARLGQTHGYKTLFIIGVAMFGTASLVGGLAPDVGVLIAMRLVQGAGAAMMFPQTLTGIQLSFSGAQRAKAIGAYAIALATGAITGQILGGVLVSANIAGSTWRPIFLVNVPVCALTLAAAARLLPPDGQRRGRQLDLIGVATLSASMVLVVLPLILGRSQGWPMWTWLALAASVPAFAVFAATQRRRTASGGAPLIDLGVLASPPVALALFALGIATGTYYGLLFALAQYIQAGLGRSALASGLVLVPWVVAFGAAGQITRRLPQRAAPILPSLGYLLLTAAYGAIAALVFTGAPAAAALAVLLTIGGLGLGTGFAPLIGHLTNAVPTTAAPDISGVSTTTLQIGAAFGVAAFGTIYLTLAAGAGQGRANDAFATTSLALAGTSLVAAIAAHLSTHPQHEIIRKDPG